MKMITNDIDMIRQDIQLFQNHFNALKEQIARAFTGHDVLIDQLLAAFFAGGHVLLEGVPGLGKTVLARTLAAATGLDYNRVQCSPDLMPADITGFNMLAQDNLGHQQLVFECGPIVSNFILVDEINRATPRTQSALLEAMQEGQISVGKETVILPVPNFFIATQNPVEHEGTYPLPEAQLDRFQVKLLVDYPDREGYRAIIAMTTGINPAVITPVLGPEEILQMQKIVRLVEVPDFVLDYAIDVVRASQPHISNITEVKENVILGASPRAVQALILTARVAALIDGRSSVSIADVESMLKPVLRHRIILNYHALAGGVNADSLIEIIREKINCA